MDIYRCSHKISLIKAADKFLTCVLNGLCLREFGANNPQIK
jgi:hypothetical protein